MSTPSVTNSHPMGNHRPIQHQRRKTPCQQFTVVAATVIAFIYGRSKFFPTREEPCNLASCDPSGQLQFEVRLYESANTVLDGAEKTLSVAQRNLEVAQKKYKNVNKDPMVRACDASRLSCHSERYRNRLYSDVLVREGELTRAKKNQTEAFSSVSQKEKALTEKLKKYPQCAKYFYTQARTTPLTWISWIKEKLF